MLSQTCDIVRPTADRPFVEVCPLVSYAGNVPDNSTKYAAVPGAKHQNLVADLDRVMTVRKDLLAQWQRHEGCLTDKERVHFAFLLERKRGRFAFPDDFSMAMRKFLGDIRKKHAKPNSKAGQSYERLKEIRVRGAPDWRAENIELTLYFIIEPNVDRTVIAPQLDKLFEKIGLPDRYSFSNPPYEIVALEDLTALAYTQSVPLDVELLSYT